MKSKYLPVWLPCLVILAMLANLVTPSPVLAAGEPPPPPGEKPSHTSQPAAQPDEPDSDTSYTANTPVGAPSGAASSAAAALSVDAIAQAGAVLVGADGNILPLAANDTLDVLAVGDVYFKGSGGAECSGSFCKYETIAEALLNFPQRNGSGTIYAAGTLVEPGAVDVISTPTLNLSKLTGLSVDGTSEYNPWINNGALTIANMLNGFSVNGFYIKYGINAHDNAGALRLQNLYVTNPGGTGINVSNHKGSIDLFNVTVFGTNGDGAHLDNTAGTGNITISNSAFIYNLNYGLYAATNGSALLNRVDANNNQNQGGAHLSVKKGVTAKDSRFNGNLGVSSGLYITGPGTMTLANVEAQGNTSDGIYLSVNNDVNINGLYVSGNAYSGLEIYSLSGNITLNNIKTFNNPHAVIADNSTSVYPKTVKVSNSQFVSTGADDGLRIRSKGNVTLNHIYADTNQGNGVSIDNALYDAGTDTYKGSGSVSILSSLGTNLFVNNTSAAVDVHTKGSITVKAVTAVNNHVGLSLDSCASQHGAVPPTSCLGKSNVTLSGLKVEGSSAGAGLTVLTGGTISLDNSIFRSNNLGVTLDNSPVATIKPITVTRSVFNFTQNSDSIALKVRTKGNISLNYVQAIYNNGKLTYTYGPMSDDVAGILLDNCLYDGGSGACTGSGTVSVSSSQGPSMAWGNSQGDGLFIHSKATVTINSFSSLYNGGGALINNQLGAGTVSITNSSFSSNIQALGGLRVHSAKAISLTGVQASLNSGGIGADIDNYHGLMSATDAVSISKSFFDHNRTYGLNVSAKGSSILNNVSAAYNNLVASSYGASISSANGGVTIKNTQGLNDFSYNSDSGLDVAAPNGAISLNGVSASGNTFSYGIQLDNHLSGTPLAITAQGIAAEHNGTNGLVVLSKGNVTLYSVQANFNTGGYGVNIDNCSWNAGLGKCDGNGNVSILSTLGLNSTNNNSYGLFIYSAGSVQINGVTARNNSGDNLGHSGVMIRNDYTAGKTVTVNQGLFNNNNAAGLTVLSAGVITLNNIASSYNVGASGDGVYLQNNVTGATPGVSILSTLGLNQFNGNTRYGIYVSSNGNIALNKVTANDNGSIGLNSGAMLYTTGASSITVICSVFNHNNDYGLFMSTGSGVLTLKGVSANFNNGGGTNKDIYWGTTGPKALSWVVCGY
jgi:putative surface-exposed virulence protein